jgi:hypothetical protein
MCCIQVLFLVTIFLHCLWDLPPPKKQKNQKDSFTDALEEKLVWKVDYPMSKWKVNSGQSTLHTKHNLKKKKKTVSSRPHLPASQPRRTNPSLHDTISHWLHGNSNPKIGCHYCWPGLIIGLGKNTHLFKLVQSMKFNSIVQQTPT